VNAALFGKLPAHGDFIARGLSLPEREAIDQWLSASLAAVQGPSFEHRFDSAVPWRFVTRGSAGAVAASQDAGGRRYPLLLALSPLTPDQADDAAAGCEALLYAAISECWTADALVAQAAALDPVRGEAAVPRWWLPGAEERALAGDRPPELIAAMLAVQEDA